MIPPIAFLGGASSPPLPWQNPDCVCWYDSRFGVTESMGAVSAWADRSSNGHDLGLKTGYASPSFTSSNADYGGEPSVDITASGGLEVAGLPLDGEITVYVVGNDGFDGSTVTNAYWFDLGSNSRIVNDFSGNAGLAIYDGAAVVSPVRGNGQRVLSLVFDSAGDDTIYVEDMATPGASGNSGSTGSGSFTLTLGNYGGGSSFGLAGSVVAFAIFNGKHDETERESTASYLRDAFALPYPAPVLTSCPYDIVDAAGVTGIVLTGTDLWVASTCTFTPTGGGTSRTATITGNTSTTVTITTPSSPPITPGQYDVTVTTAGGTSNALTVIVEADPQVWLNAARATVVTGGAVSDIPNSATSPVDLSVSQSDGAKRPTFEASSAHFGSKPTIVFVDDGWARYLDSALLGADVPQPLTFCAVLRYETAGANPVVFDGTPADPQRTALLLDGDALWAYAGAGFSGGIYVRNNKPAIVVCVVLDGASSDIYVNGVLAVSGNAGDDNLRSLRVGAHVFGILPFGGELAALGAFATNDTDVVDRMTATMIDEYSIPPFLYSSAPGTGGAIDFTGSALDGLSSCVVTPSGGGAALTGTLSGNTSTAFTFMPFTITPGNYDVVVTNANGSSNTLTITVS